VRAVELVRERAGAADAYPWSLPVVRGLERLDFDPGVTFLVGENGSGKSTLIEALAVCLGLNPEGGTQNFAFATRESHSPLHEALRPVRGARTVLHQRAGGDEVRAAEAVDLLAQVVVDHRPHDLVQEARPAVVAVVWEAQGAVEPAELARAELSSKDRRAAWSRLSVK
jgi:ATPase subunit of ABC transporter with duplicated ATPase domains